MPFPCTKYFFFPNTFKTFPSLKAEQIYHESHKGNKKKEKRKKLYRTCEINCSKIVLRVEGYQNHAWIGISWLYQMAIKVKDHHKNQSKDFS